MGRHEKRLAKLREATRTFPWSELVTLLDQLGFKRFEREGSRVVFEHEQTRVSIHLHKPHPENHIKGGALKSVRQTLKQEGYL